MVNFKERMQQKRSFQAEGHASELEHNEAIIIVEDKGNNFIYLTLEPDKLDALSMKCRLTFEESMDAVGRFFETEEEDWHELRMKDQVNGLRDEIIKDTMLKFVKEHHDIDREKFNGIEIAYNKRYNQEGHYIGEAIILSMYRL